MTQENEAKLIDTIKQIISKVNALTDEVNQLKANQKQQLHKRYVEPMDIEDGLIQMDFSQQAFSEKQAIYLCRKDSYWPTMNQLVKIKEFKSYKEVSVTAQKY